MAQPQTLVSSVTGLAHRQFGQTSVPPSCASQNDAAPRQLWLSAAMALWLQNEVPPRGPGVALSADRPPAA